MTPRLKIVRLPHSEGLPLPAYETEGAAGLDIRAAFLEATELKPFQRLLVPTGLSIEIPADHEAQMRPRSGLAIKHGITLVNSPGTVDEDYRGEISVPLINLSGETFLIERGMRIAQMIIAPVVRVDVEEVAELAESGRGAGGFGSTGTA